MLIINARIPQNNGFSPDMCVRLDRGCIAAIGEDLAPIDAVRMCTATPAESVGERVVGHMVPGSPAPLIRWSKDWELMDIVEG